MPDLSMDFWGNIKMLSLIFIHTQHYGLDISNKLHFTVHISCYSLRLIQWVSWLRTYLKLIWDGKNIHICGWRWSLIALPESAILTVQQYSYFVSSRADSRLRPRHGNDVSSSWPSDCQLANIRRMLAKYKQLMVLRLFYWQTLEGC